MCLAPPLINSCLRPCYICLMLQLLVVLPSPKYVAISLYLPESPHKSHSYVSLADLDPFQLRTSEMWPCQMACGVKHITEKEFQNAHKRVRLETCPAKIIGAFPSLSSSLSHLCIAHARDRVPGERVEVVIYIEPLTCRCKGHHTRSQRSTATIKGQSTSLYTAEVFSCFKAVPNGESDCLPDPGRTGAEPSIHIGWSNIDSYYIIRGLPNLVIRLKYGCVQSESTQYPMKAGKHLRLFTSPKCILYLPEFKSRYITKLKQNTLQNIQYASQTIHHIISINHA